MSQHLVVKQSSVADVRLLDEVSWPSLPSHKPVARLTMVLTWPQPHREHRERGVRREASTFLCLVGVIGLLLAFATVVLGTISLSGALLEKIRSLPRYNQPQAQYSDLWKWQGRR